MSSLGSPQSGSNTCAGTESRKGTVLDIFDHGPLIAVVGGTFTVIEPHSVRLCFRSDTGVDREAWNESYFETPRPRMTVTFDVTRHIPTHAVLTTDTIYLYNTKHNITFVDATLRNWKRSNDTRTLSFSCADYTVKTGWHTDT